VQLRRADAGQGTQRDVVAGGEADDLIVQVQKLLERDVQKISRAAGGVENPLLAEVLAEIVQRDAHGRGDDIPLLAIRLGDDLLNLRGDSLLNG